ncbi:Apple-like protein [Artemisia annua]|uniref:Apple-like protein n=1 Tax=Artemisia annua TaxID=35608 RepID=A0A2U1NPD2_ARTAN|nr:Apple-like protein [Artemisia annua]
MKIISNKKTGKEMRLTSWVNGEDPRLGIFSMGLDPNRHQFYIWKGNEPYMRSNVYATTSSYTTHYNQGLSAYFAFDVKEDGVSLVYTLSKNTVRSRVTLSPSGQIQVLIWEQTAWKVQSQVPISTCDFYGYCGPFTVCEKNDPVSVYKCLNNFYPKSHNEWSVGNWTAYAYQNVPYEVTIVCLNWFRELVGIERHNVYNVRDLYVRIHNSKLERIERELLGFDSICTTSGSGDVHNSAELVSFSLRSALAATVSEWAWEIWMEGRGVELIDPSTRDNCKPLQAVKCINVGLLCVQEMMNDRPTMSEVIVMLSNETATIPLPKKPAFKIHRSSQMPISYSDNEVTVTNIDPR